MYRSSRYVRPVLWSCALVLGCVLLVSACGLAPLPRGPASYGFPNSGVLLHGRALPNQGPGFVRAKPGDDTRWGSPLLVDALMRAALAVSERHPGGAPLKVGDLSARHGGRHASHGSHRTGRDADLLFYLTDPRGQPVRGSGFYAFDRRGVSVPAAGATRRELAFFDTARNWALVRALVMDEQVPVQWIFCAEGVKARLLAYGAAHEPDAEVLVRASYVVHQPTYGNIHDDHFHVRIGCTAEERAQGCRDAGPVWPWQRNEHEKPAWEGPGHDDVALVKALLEGGPDGEAVAQNESR